MIKLFTLASSLDAEPILLTGTAGNDILVGTDTHDLIEGLAGADVLHGGSGWDVLRGGIGNDYLYGGFGRDRLFGGTQDDWLFGEGGNDVLYGERGHDALYGGAGNDALYGGAGLDALYGGDGNDRLSGGSDTDWMTGGTGADRFVFNSQDVGAVDVWGPDTISDFAHAEDDLIDLSALATFGGSDLPLTFIGTAQFSGNGNEVRVVETNGSVVVLVDLFNFTDPIFGNQFDFRILVENVSELVAGDFVL